MISKENMNKLIRKRIDCKIQLQDVEHELASVLTEFDGTVEEAIYLGLVKPNFPMPRGFPNYLKSKYNVD